VRPRKIAGITLVNWVPCAANITEIRVCSSLGGRGGGARIREEWMKGPWDTVTARLLCPWTKQQVGHTLVCSQETWKLKPKLISVIFKHSVCPGNWFYAPAEGRCTKCWRYSTWNVHWLLRYLRILCRRRHVACAISEAPLNKTKGTVEWKIKNLWIVYVRINKQWSVIDQLLADSAFVCKLLVLVKWQAACANSTTWDVSRFGKSTALGWPRHNGMYTAKCLIKG
jgi:hypothetical protein